MNYGGCHCSGTGDVHYYTYDLVWIHHQGDCTYVMSQTVAVLDDDLTPFHVYINAEKTYEASTVSWTSEIYVGVFGLDIALTTSPFVLVGLTQIICGFFVCLMQLMRRFL